MRLSNSTVRALCALGGLGIASGLAACGEKKAEAAPVQTTPVSRQNVVVDVEATGVIQPIGAVDVRSKTSGQIVEMKVQTGSQVKQNDLLARIDPRDAQNRLTQARAALAAAHAQEQVTKAQYDRNAALSKQGVITAPELESARIAYANAQSQVATAQTGLESAQIGIEDVTIQAPTTGTVIATNVVPGQVIASSTNSPSGGTVLMTLANLGSVYDSTLVNESDIGKVKPGQQATITVDAYPGRTFRGTVEKIEPRATVQQSVTMFPVKIRIENMDGALMPGMNSDVSILVDNRQDVLTVPVDAVRPTRDATTAAAALGLDTNKVKATMQGQGNRGGPQAGDTGAGAGVPVSRDGVNGGQGGQGGPNGARGQGGQGGGQNAQGGQGGQGGQGRGGQGGNFGGPPPSAAQCDSVNKAFAAHPKQRARLDSLMQAMRSGAGDFQSARETMRALYDSIGVDARTARGCRGGGQGGQGGNGGQGGGSFAGGQGGQGGGFGGGGGGFGGGNNRRGNTRGIVFVQSGTTYEPRLVQLGLSNFDVVEIVSGLREGERVALVSGAVQAQNRTNMQNRMRSNSGLPGMGGGGAGGGGGRPGGGGGGGGPRGG